MIFHRGLRPVVGFVGTKFKKQKVDRPQSDEGQAGEHLSEDQTTSYDDERTIEQDGPLVLSRTEHPISRKLIDSDALKVMYRLLRAGYKAHLVGGAVRDLILGRTPKDYDVATDAKPEAVRTLFRNSRIIGRRFKLNHVFFRGNKIVEVATFRALGEPPEDESDTVTLAADNTYGDPKSDALRRDLTINGLFYDLGSYCVIDYVGGIRDLEDRVVRIIGNPDVRLREDPVRMIRAIRHAARTGFTIEPETYQSICRNAELIELCPRARVHEEFFRELKGGYALESFRLLKQTGLIKYLMPIPELKFKSQEETEEFWRRLEESLRLVDEVTQAGREISPAVLFLSVLLAKLPPEAPLFRSPKEDYRLAQFSRDFVAHLWTPGEDKPEAQGQDEPPGPEAAQSQPEESEHEPAGERKPQSHLRKMLHQIYWPLGVSRKEREHMEGLLGLRFSMLDPQPPKKRRQPLYERPFFDDALLLLSFSAHDETTRERLRYWQARLTGAENESEEPDHRPRRRRPRRRRRRGGRGGRQNLGEG